MSKAVDFTDCPIRKKAYAGMNGSKLSIVYNNELYMLKFPSVAKRNPEISYTNGTISEYLGCHILAALGFETQETILGTYKINGKDKIVVACKDFTENKYVLQDFASLKNTIVDSINKGKGTELASIMETIEKQRDYNPVELKNFFWDLFIADALIGNWDRHNGNWGSLYDPESDTVRLAPIYDCGSSMNPGADEKTIEEVLSDKNQLMFRVYEIPTSAIEVDKKRLNYFDFISSLENDDCNAALKRIYPKIDMEKINKIIEETPFIDKKHKDFLKSIINARKELILEHSYNKLLRRELSLDSEIETGINVIGSESFGRQYVDSVLNSMKTMPLKEAVIRTHGELINMSQSDSEKIAKQGLLNTYLKKHGINSNKEFIAYIKKLEGKSTGREKKSSKSYDDFLER